jgi:hypothetical protein
MSTENYVNGINGIYRFPSREWTRALMDQWAQALFEAQREKRPYSHYKCFRLDPVRGMGQSPMETS